ncbi:hypothetical protein VT84_31185 [Gemmata sp. SH-PL17]|nr:hypothetical protein VT84_31185 [Gemmata sp. SH-PL17]
MAVSTSAVAARTATAVRASGPPTAPCWPPPRPGPRRPAGCRGGPATTWRRTHRRRRRQSCSRSRQTARRSGVHAASGWPGVSRDCGRSRHRRHYGHARFHPTGRGVGPNRRGRPRPRRPSGTRAGDVLPAVRAFRRRPPERPAARRPRPPGPTHQRQRYVPALSARPSCPRGRSVLWSRSWSRLAPRPRLRAFMLDHTWVRAFFSFF